MSFICSTSRSALQLKKIKAICSKLAETLKIVKKKKKDSTVFENIVYPKGKKRKSKYDLNYPFENNDFIHILFIVAFTK